MKKFLFLLLGCVFVGIHSFVLAQIRTDPDKVKFELEQGKSISGTIDIYNSSDKDYILNAYFVDVEFTAPFDGTMEMYPLGSTLHSCGGWITVSPSKFIVPAGGKQDVSYTITPPRDAKGSYYGVLFFEREEGTGGGGPGVGVTYRVGTTFYLDAKNGRMKEGKVEDLEVDKEKIKGSLVNSGNILLFPQGTNFFMDDKGVPAARGTINKLFIPPGEKAPFSIPLSTDVTPGTYSLLLNFDLENGDVLVKEAEVSKGADGVWKIIKLKD